MATLTETAYYTKRFLAGLVSLIVLLVFFKLSLNYYRAYQARKIPPTEPTPTVAFGKLPALRLPVKTRRTTNFTVGTLDGRIPRMPKMGTIFFIPPRPGFTFFTKERALSFARKFGFLQEPIVLSGEEYKWTDAELPQRTFTLNIFTNNFTLDCNFATDSAVLSNAVPKKNEAETLAKSFLLGKNLLPEDLSKGEITSEYLIFDGQTLKKAPSFTEANLVQVDFFQQKINDLPVLTEEYNKGLVSFIISGSSEEKKKVLKLEYTFWPADLENSASYPLKTGDEAFEELKAGGGAIVLGGEQTEATIRNVYLAYLDTKKYQEFLQPTFVFEGDGGFVAYVAAVKGEWTEPLVSAIYD